MRPGPKPRKHEAGLMTERDLGRCAFNEAGAEAPETQAGARGISCLMRDSPPSMRPGPKPRKHHSSSLVNSLVKSAPFNEAGAEAPETPCLC